jgi:hypothetical protein
MNHRKKKPQTFVRYRGTREVFLVRREAGVWITLYDAMSQGELQRHLKAGWEVYRTWTNG